MKKTIMLLTIFLSIFIVAPSVVFATDYSVSINDVSVGENSGTAQFTVSVNPAIQDGDEVTVDYNTTSGSAVTGFDFSTTTGTLNFNNDGDTQKIITVTINNDDWVEFDENFFVGLMGESFTQGTGGPGTVSITDNEGEGTITNDDQFGITVNNSSAPEGSNVTFTITVDAPRSMDVDVTYTTVDGTATLADSDYTQHVGTVVTIPAGIANQTQPFTVATTGDTNVENDETFSVTLSSTHGSFDGNDDTGTGTITDNDEYSISISGNPSVVEGNQASFTVTVSPQVQAGDTVTVQYSTSNGSAVSPGDYTAETNTVLTFSGGESSKNATVDTNDDAAVENDETFTVTLGNPTTSTGSVSIADPGPKTGTITDNDEYSISISGNPSVVEGNQASFTVTVSPQVQAGDTVTVQYSTSNGSAVSPGDYTAETNTVLTFSGGESSKNATVDTNDDAAVENDETFTVTLSNPTTSTGSVSIADPGPKTGTITDNDEYSISISGNPSVVEGNQASFTVTVSPQVQAGDTVTVQYSTSNGSAVSPGDYTAETNTVLTFSGGESSKNATVDTNDDAAVENDETFTVTLSNPTTSTGSVSIADPGPKTGTITDNDEYSISISGNPSVVEGNQASFTVTVSPQVQAGDTVTVQYSTSNGSAVSPGDYTAETNTVLTFSGGESSKNATVDTNDDTILENDETFTVTINSPSTSTGSVSIADPGPQTGTIQDDGDTYDVSIEPVETVTEGTDATVTFTVTLDQEVPGGTSVSFTLDDVTAVAGSDYSENTSGPAVNFAANETAKDIVVNIINDAVYEAPETFEVKITSADPNAILGNDTGTCTINDDGIDTYSVSISALAVPDPVLEADTTVIFTVTLGQEVPGGASVDFSLNDVTAALGSDYSENTANPLNFAAGETSKDIVVNIINDLVDETSETFEVIITSADANAILGNDTSTCTITDNDYTVTFDTATVGPLGIDGGTVNGVLSLDQVVEHGNDCVAVSATPNAGYRFVEWTGDYNGTVNPLTITNVTSNMTITANFIAIYTITATAGANGTISPSGAVIVDYGTDQTFIFDPNTCYEVDNVDVDLVSEGGDIREYTFVNVTADHTIDVQFYHYDCTITATAEHGGTITPSGALTVSCGSAQSFTISAGMGNEIAEVLVDGVDLGVGPGITTHIYNWTNIKKDDDDTSPCVHYIVAKFKRPPLSCMDISDVPLNAMSRSAPANIMFVLDDSGSMDWEFMTDENNGLFNGEYYVFNNPGDNIYSNANILSGADRLRWKSQWSGYNRMYYDPNVDYRHWPNLSDADPDLPQSHPMHAGHTLDLSGIYESFDDGIVIDNQDGAPTFTTPTGNWYESGASPEYNGSSYYSNNAGATATWTPNLPTAGNYEVWVYWASSSGWDRDASAQYTIHDTIGDHVFVRDQRVNYGQWNLMGTFSFAAGGSGYVTLTRGSGGATSADAVKFVSTAGGGSISITNAHYYVWSAAESKPYLVIINGGSIEYCEVNDDGDDLVETGELALSGSPPADVVTGRSPAEERQNFANWYSFYRKRELTATAAIANVITNMKGVQIGLRGINGYDSNIVKPVHKIKVGGVDETSTLLNMLYGFELEMYGTPLRRGLEAVGRYFHQYDGQTGGLGTSPYATAADGGECQQSFAIVMTDGYWNGNAPYTGAIANNDGDGSSAYDGAAPHGDEPYGDGYSDTLADVAMYYYENDLSSTLGPEVPINPWDDNKQQHMVTYGVSFGVTGTLDPNGYDFETTFPTWPNPTSGDQQRIDDLWHASVNGRGFFLSASNPNELVNSLLDIMQNIEEREGSASSVSVNGDELYTKLSGGGDILMFQSSYDTENWTGDVKAYQVCTELTGNCAGKSIGDIIKSPYVWSANEKLGGLNWNTGREIVTYNGTDAGKPFRWGDLTATQKAFLNNDSTLLDYLRGDTSNEVNNGGAFRDRFAKLGDMVHSSPTFENGVLYAGGNDGMLHAFAAADDEPYAGAVGGEELFAYVPNLVFDNLSQLADPNYTHKYFVDLTPTVKAGVDISGVSTTVLVGGLGKGGRGYYALNVTDPASWTSEGTIDDKVMWEYPKAAVTDDDMGYSFSKPAIVECNDSTLGWIVIFGNGYNSQNGHAVLYIVNPGTGDLIKKIDTNVDGCNGLSTLVPIDVNYDNKVDYVYAGDMRGNMWKFDLTDIDFANWEVAFDDGGAKPLFQAQGPGGTTQSITAKPDVMYHPTEHGYMVLFGTGQYLGESDISETTAQSFYGIWDYGDDADDREYLGSFKRGFAHELSNQPTTVTLLAQQVIPSESPDPNVPDFWTVTINQGQPDEYDLLLRLTTNNEIVWETMDDPDAIQNPPEFLPDLSDTNDNHAGWYFDLPLSGERGTVDMMIRGGIIIAISFIPEDSPCGYGGDSVIHEMSAASGARLTVPQFDINGDGVIDDNDMINIGTDADPIWVAPSGMKKAGQLQPPAILIDPERGVEIKYFSSSSGSIETVYEKPPLLGISHWREFE